MTVFIDPKAPAPYEGDSRPVDDGIHIRTEFATSPEEDPIETCLFRVETWPMPFNEDLIHKLDVATRNAIGQVLLEEGIVNDAEPTSMEYSRYEVPPGTAEQ